MSFGLNMSYDICIGCIWALETAFSSEKHDKMCCYSISNPPPPNKKRISLQFKHQSNIYFHFTDLFITMGIYQRLDKYLTGIYNHFQIYKYTWNSIKMLYWRILSQLSQSSGFCDYTHTVRTQNSSKRMVTFINLLGKYLIIIVALIPFFGVVLDILNPRVKYCWIDFFAVPKFGGGRTCRAYMLGGKREENRRVEGENQSSHSTPLVYERWLFIGTLYSFAEQHYYWFEK